MCITFSFACAQFIATTATIGTSFEPTPGKTIGIYAAVLLVQGEVLELEYVSYASHTNITKGSSTLLE